MKRYYVFICSVVVLFIGLKQINAAEIQRKPWYSTGYIYPGSLNPWPFSHPLPPAPGTDPGNLRYWSQGVDVPPMQPATIYGAYLPDIWEDGKVFSDPTQFNPIDMMRSAAMQQPSSFGKRRRRFPLPDNVDSLPPLPPSQVQNFGNEKTDNQQGMSNFQRSFSSPYDQPSQVPTNWRDSRVNGWQRTQPLDSLNQGMQKEVWNSWMPGDNYGIHMGSRPDFGKGGFMAPRALLSAQQLFQPQANTG